VLGKLQESEITDKTLRVEPVDSEFAWT